METIKCESCGSTEYQKIGINRYKCDYCGATFRAKSKQNKNFDPNNFFEEGFVEYLKFFKVKESKEEFKKAVFSKLAMTKDVPEDVLNCSFSEVKLEHVYFVYFDMKFSVMKNDGMLEYIGSAEPCNCVTEGTLQDMANQINLNRDRYRFAKIRDDYNSSEDVRLTDISKEELYEAVEEIAEAGKELFIQKNKLKSNVTYNINNIQLWAIPKYSIEFTYKGKNYKMESFADMINVYGEMPMLEKNEKEYEKEFKQEMKRTTGIPSFISTIICLVIALFSLSNFLFFRYYRFLIVELILMIVSAVILVGNIALYAITNAVKSKKVKGRLFTRKKQNLINRLNKEKLQLDSNDELNIKSYLGGY